MHQSCGVTGKFGGKPWVIIRNPVNIGVVRSQFHIVGITPEITHSDCTYFRNITREGAVQCQLEIATIYFEVCPVQNGVRLKFQKCPGGIKLFVTSHIDAVQSSKGWRHLVCLKLKRSRRSYLRLQRSIIQINEKGFILTGNEE